jgi:glycosyltransferase involved in cell wall biosynthesis
MSLKVLSKLDALFRQYRPAVVHTHLLALNYAYPLMIRYRTPARVYTVHNLAEKDIGLRTAPMVRALAFRYRVGKVVPVAIAEEVRATIQRVYGYPDPPLIPNGIPTDEYAPNPDTRAQWRQAHGIEPRATVLTHIGRFAVQKNHALLVEAFAQVHSDAPLYLLLVGGGELEERRARAGCGAGLAGARALSGGAGGCARHSERFGSVRAVVALGGQSDVGDGGDGGGAACGQHGGWGRA